MNRFSLCLGVACATRIALFVAAAGEAPPAKMTDVEAKLLELTNLERKRKELPPLRANPRLLLLARAHSANMAKQSKMEHTLDGKTPFDRMRDAGYQFVKGGENIAACDARVNLAEVMKVWMESKAHRDNILLPEYTEIGVGTARDKDGQIYFTQLFARPRDKE